MRTMGDGCVSLICRKCVHDNVVCPICKRYGVNREEIRRCWNCGREDAKVGCDYCIGAFFCDHDCVLDATVDHADRCQRDRKRVMTEHRLCVVLKMEESERDPDEVMKLRDTLREMN